MTTTLEAPGTAPYGNPDAIASVISPRSCRSCGKALEARPGPGRPAVYCGPECRAKADNQRDRDRRAAEKTTLDWLARSGRLEPKQPPVTSLPDDYWTGLALAVEVVTVHGPATDTPDDPRLPRSPPECAGSSTRAPVRRR
jgi:hypothetical protein